ncbi:MAG: 4-alpha-glucanotransferase [Defluviitaleaceae bacterium]|nr:4-alpha-glucanotransferase [Defluviitaleaceae bacterium]
MKLSRKAGVLLHPTSFPSPYGIGDLGQYAYDFIDFLEDSNQTLWQILPLGPTSFGDSPYQSFSTFAGNTLLISPKLLEKDGLLHKSQMHIPNFSDNRVDYGHVQDYKHSLFVKAFENFVPNADYKKFCKQNWVNDYALFISLKKHFIEERKNGGKGEEYAAYKKLNKKYLSPSAIDDCYFGAIWNSWPQDIANRKPAAIKHYTNLLRSQIDYEKFLQYEFFRQWGLLKTYANKKDVQIIGDIPIFVSIDSCDVWTNPKLFYLDTNNNPTVVAGVPPDYFSEKGQLWGNPLYNWEAHKAEKFAWWKARMKACLQTVDVVRVDHFRGFEAYWSVKYGAENAIKGKWEKGIGKELFVALRETLGQDLPIIAEDLGVITPEVEALRDDLGLPGMKILQFAFGGDEKNLYLPHSYPHKNCVVYTGTHDNDTTIGWYNTATEKQKDHFRRYTNSSGHNSAWDMMRLAYSTVADYCIIPLQDILIQDSYYRMNTPGEAENNWKYRYDMHAFSQEIIDYLCYLTELYNRKPVKKHTDQDLL